MKLCIDCKHFKLNPVYPEDKTLGKCGRKGLVSTVDGSPNDPFCKMERTHHGTCGYDAIHWVQASFPHQDPKEPQSQDMDPFGRILTPGA